MDAGPWTEGKGGKIQIQQGRSSRRGHQIAPGSIGQGLQ